MGVRVRVEVDRAELGEPVGTMYVEEGSDLGSTTVGADELPLVIDEVPILAVLAAHAPGDTWFHEAGELRIKESDRLRAVARGIRDLGGHAADEGPDLVIAGGGLDGGRVSSGGDHRIAMAFADRGARGSRAGRGRRHRGRRRQLPRVRRRCVRWVRRSRRWPDVAPRVVAIDGAAGAGKSTLARSLARVLSLAYLNTGSMYRALAAARRAPRRLARRRRAPGRLDRRVEVQVRRGTTPPELEIEGWPEAALRTFMVESSVSSVARHPGVRMRLCDLQRRLGRDGAVVEGRDIGAVVFPDAPVKLFLVAHPSARSSRRADERHVDDRSVAAALRARDALDARTNPLEPAAGAIVLDTTDLDVDETLEAALSIVGDLAPELLP